MFQVGQEVECIADTGGNLDAFGREYRIKKGEIYIVSGCYIWDGYIDKGMEYITLVGITPDRAPGWEAKAFRPVQKKKTDISIFTKMLNTKKIREKA